LACSENARRAAGSLSWDRHWRSLRGLLQSP
jgi:hypothetical protein